MVGVVGGVEAGTLVAFAAASALLILSPGPMVAYIVATSLSHGRRAGLTAVAGATLAAAVQLAVVAAGLSAALTLAGATFFWIKWAAVGYLAYLAVRAWRAPAPDLSAPTTPRSLRRLFIEAFLVNISNPKTLLFHGAFLPAFVSPTAPPGPQLATLAIVFLAIAATLDSGWALAAGWARDPLSRVGRSFNRVTACIYAAAATAMATLRR